MFSWDDMVRRAQGHYLAALGFGPVECPYRIPASSPLWCLRDYGGGGTGGPPLLIVSAPIKRPYLWDLSPQRSVVRTCLAHGFRVYLLEWVPPQPGLPGGNLEDYASTAIGACADRIAAEAGAGSLALMGHSLGGTFAAIFAATMPQSVKALVLLGAPLCFDPSSSRFSAAVADKGPASLGGTDIVPGSLLSEFCAFVSPEIFIWARFEDAARCFADPARFDTHMRIERWALDEVALSGRLVENVLQWLYRENRFYQGTLPMAGKLVGPSKIVSPTLAVITTADDVASLQSIKPFIAAMTANDARAMTYPGEPGVGLQHLGILAGREAHARVWPEIMSWLKAHS
jgi:polyhydroxyalkanoate synthase